MASFDLGNITSALSDLKEYGVSINGKALKLESEHDAKDLIGEISNCKNLQYLDLEGNTLGVDAAKGIGDVLAKHPEMKKALWKDLFTGRMKTEIPLALEHLGKGLMTAGARLTVLNAGHNALGPNGMAGLMNLLKSSTCFSLQEIVLENCGLGVGGTRMLAKALLECHTESVKANTPLALKVFIAGRNRLENEGAKAMSEVFATLKSLERIEIPQNGIYHAGMTVLSESFKENPNLQILNLNDNTIGPKGANALAEAFYSIQSIKEINFGDCLLKSQGANALSEALCDGHNELEILNLGFNEIGPMAGETVAASMDNKPRLRQLILDGNMFGDESVDVIREIFERYGNPDALSLEEDDGINSDIEEEIDEEEQDDEETEEEDEEEVNSDEAEEGELYISETSLSSTIPNLEIFNDTLNQSSYNGDTSIGFEPASAGSFCLSQQPTKDLFNQIAEKDKLTAIREFLKTIVEAQYLSVLSFAVLNCSFISDSCKDALDVSNALYKDAFEYAKNNDRVRSLRNFFLAQLGLLKSEEKHFKLFYNVPTCRSALEHAIKQHAIPDEEKNIFQVFLNASN